MAQETCTVLIWGSEELLAEGLRKLLDGEGFQASVQNAVEIGSLPADAPDPDVLLLLEYPERGSALRDAVTRLIEGNPDLRLVILRPSFTVEEISDAIEMSAHALLLRSISCEALSHAIRLILLDETLIPIPCALQLLMHASEDERRGREAFGAFSGRELEILRCLVHGLPNKGIANRLCLSEATVKIQIRQLLKKIGARNRTQAAIWALGRGVAGPPAGAPEPGKGGSSVSELFACTAEGC